MPAVGSVRKPSVAQPGREPVALALQRAGQRARLLVGHRHAHGRGVLERRAAGEGQELLDRAHARDQLRRPAGPADLPAGQGVRLAQRRRGHGALGHPGQRGQGHVRAVVDQVLVHLVGHGDQVVAAADRGQQLQLVALEHPPGGVVRRVQHQHAGAVGQRGLDGRLLEPPPRRVQDDRAHARPGALGDRGVRVVGRIQRDDLVALGQERQQRRRDGLGGAERDLHPRRRVDLQPVAAALVLGDGLAQHGDARAAARTGCARRAAPRRPRPR